MTCVSPTSGMASSGAFFSDHAPVTAAAAASSRTRMRLRTEKSMTRAIIASPLGLHAAFRIEEERPGDGDALARRESAPHRDARVDPPPDLHLPGFEPS